MVIDTLDRLRGAIAQALPAAAVVAVHTEDLSDANTGRWLVRLPGVYLTCAGVEARAAEASLTLRAYVLARMADLRKAPSVSGWALAESVLAVLAADALTQRARLIYRDGSGLDQPGIGLWEIEARLHHRLAVDAGATDGLRAEEFWASWVPFVGLAHKGFYTRLDTEPQVGHVPIEELLP